MHEAPCPSPGTFRGSLAALSSASFREFPTSQRSTHCVHSSEDPRTTDNGLEPWGPPRRTGAGHLFCLALGTHVDWTLRGMRVRMWPGGYSAHRLPRAQGPPNHREMRAAFVLHTRCMEGTGLSASKARFPEKPCPARRVSSSLYGGEKGRVERLRNAQGHTSGEGLC